MIFTEKIVTRNPVEKDVQVGAEIGYISDNVNAYKYVDSNNDDAVGPYDPNDHEMDYDGGNLVLDNRQYSYGYDYENRLIEIRDHTSDLIIRSYYDALGRRVARKIFDDADSVASRTDRYCYNDRWQIMRIDTDEPQDNTQVRVSTREFVYGNGIDEPLFMDRTTYGQTTQTTRCYYIHDNLGGVVALAGETGSVVESYKYSPWGEPTIYSGSGEIKTESQFENPYLFAGREVDILDGGMLKLQNNRTRTYNYLLARWMRNDSSGYVDSMNMYEYVRSRPLFYIDPFGRAAIVGPVNLPINLPPIDPIVDPTIDPVIPTNPSDNNIWPTQPIVDIPNVDPINILQMPDFNNFQIEGSFYYCKRNMQIWPYVAEHAYIHHGRYPWGGRCRLTGEGIGYTKQGVNPELAFNPESCWNLERRSSGGMIVDGKTI